MGTISTAYKQDERRFTVYMHITPSGKKYIGITGRSVRVRWHPHHYKDCRAFYKAIQKYGWDSISHRIVSVGLTREEAERAERYLIQKYNTTDGACGYNILVGGDVSDGISDEGRKRLSEFHKGRKQSDETKKKHREATIKNGRAKKVVCYETGEVFETATDAAKSVGVNVSSLIVAVDVPSNTSGGYHWVSQDNLSEYQPVINGIEGKKRRVVVVETGESFSSISEAAKRFQTTDAAIVNVCKGRNKTCLGYHMKYEGEPDPEYLHTGRFDNVKRKVRLVETGVVYGSVTEASKATGIKTELIINVCKGKSKATHGFRFQYEDPPLKRNSESQYVRVKHPKAGFKKHVMCIETGIVYQSMNKASKETGVQRKSITRSCENKTATAGGFHWIYCTDN